MATIEKRSGKNGISYMITVSAGYDDQGKQIRQRITYRPKETTAKKIEKEIQTVATDFEKRVNDGKYYDAEKITFQQFTSTWFNDWAVKHLTLAIQEKYLGILKRRVFPHIGGLKLSKITALHIQNILQEEEKEGKAVKTVKDTFTAVNSVFRYAFRMNIVQENVCLRCELPRTKKKTELHYFNLDQTKRFLKALTLEYDYKVGGRRRKDSSGNEYAVRPYTAKKSIPFQYQVFFYLAIYCAFRRGEMVALKWEDVDFRNKRIIVRRAASKTKAKGVIIKEPKTESGKRILSLPDSCADKLKSWKKEQKALSFKLGTAWKGFRGEDFDKNYIFIQDDGTMIHPDTPYKKFKKIVKAYNDTLEDEKEKLPAIRLHDLRHTSATLLLSEGVDIETVSHRLGHSKASITLDVYGHCLPEKDESAAAKINEMLS